MLAALALLAVLAPLADVRVRVRTPGAACTLQDASGASAADRLAGAASGGWTWKRLPGDVLSCTGNALEPLDVAPGTTPLPAALALELLPARQVTLEGGATDADGVVEWRAPATPGTTLLARRGLRMGPRLALAVATQARVLRVHRPGAAPISLYLPEGDRALTVRLPEPQPGGELFGVLPQHAFLPQGLELAAGRTKLAVAPSAWRVFQAALPAGSYTLTPRYRGGVAGAPIRVAIQAGRSLELLPLSLPEPGAVSLAVPPEACAPEHLPARLSLRRVGARSPSPLLVDEAIPAAPCQRDIEGLPEGTYEAVLARPGEPLGSLASAVWDVLPGERTTVTLASPEVRVGGRVTFGPDQPAAGFVVGFEGEEQRWSTRTDENGEYAASLGPAGDYGIAIGSAAGVPSASLVRRFVRGEQRADFELSEAALTVRLGRPDGTALAEPVQVTVISKEGRRLTTRWVPGTEAELRFRGLDFGEYWVTGLMGHLASTSEARVELTSEAPEGEVDLVLEQQQGRLRVVDEQGAPVPGLAVSAGSLLLEAQPDGSFTLGGVPSGERLKVQAPGFVPACRILQPQDLPELRVVLSRPTERLVLRVAEGLAWGSGLLFGLPGSTCPLEVTELEFDEQAAGPRRTTVVLQVPPGSFRLAVGATSYSVAAGREIEIEPPATPR